jgi:hypothetical protein
VTGAAASAVAVPFRSTSNTSLQEPHLGRVAARRPSDPDISISLGAHGAIFFSSPSLPPDVPRTPGTRGMESQPAVSTGHPAAGTPALSRGHLSRGHTRTASRLLGRASYA